MNFKNTGNSTSLCTAGRIKYRIFWDAFWSTRCNSNTFRAERHYCYSHYSWNFFFPPSTMTLMLILTETQRFSRKTDYERGSRREEIQFEQPSTVKYYYEWLFQMGRQEDKHWQKKFHVHRSQSLTHTYSTLPLTTLTFCCLHRLPQNSTHTNILLHTWNTENQVITIKYICTLKQYSKHVKIKR